MLRVLVAHTDGTGTETLGELLRSFERAPMMAVVLAAATMAFERVLRRTTLGRRARRLRLLAWIGAMVVLWVALASPVDVLGAHLVSGHMLQHMLLGDLAPALAVLAMSGGAAAVISGWVARRTPLRIPPWAGVALAVLGWAVVWGVWHAPFAYEAALRIEPVHMAEHLSLIVVGVALWWVIVDPMGRRAEQTATRIGVAVLALFFGTALANALMIATEPTYPLLAGEAERIVGWSSTWDLHFAGMIMIVMQMVTVGIALVVLVRRHLATNPRVDAVTDAQVASTGAHPLGW